MYGRAIRQTLLLLLGGLLGVALFTYAFDPLQQYRKARMYRPYFDDQRYLVPGMAKTFEYDSVIIGTSVADNFLKSDVDETLGVNSVKLTMGGASAYEECLVLYTALRTGRVHSAIVSFDIASYQGSPSRLRYGPGSVPFYLYDDSRWNDYQYLLNMGVLYKWCSRVVLSNVFGVNADRLNEDKAFYWGDRDPVGREHLSQSWQTLAVASLPAVDHSSETLWGSFQANTLMLVRAHPEVRFHFFYPPYALAYWAALDKKGLLDEYLRFKRQASEALLAEPNAAVHDFQDIDWITADTEGYSNLAHYAPKINKFILNSIADGSQRLTAANLDERIARLREQARAYDPEAALGGSAGRP